MKLASMSAMAIAIKIDARTARSMMSIGKTRWDNLKRSAQESLGFRLFHPDSLIPTASGRAWAEAAYRVYRKSEELIKVAEPLRDGPVRPKEKWNISTQQILEYKNNRHVEWWLGVEIVSDWPFLTANGVVLQPLLEELCELIKRTNNLANTLKMNRSDTSPTTSPSLQDSSSSEFC